jgi:hypothetical protein
VHVAPVELPFLYSVTVYEDPDAIGDANANAALVTVPAVGVEAHVFTFVLLQLLDGDTYHVPFQFETTAEADAVPEKLLVPVRRFTTSLIVSLPLTDSAMPEIVQPVVLAATVQAAPVLAPFLHSVTEYVRVPIDAPNAKLALVIAPADGVVFAQLVEVVLTQLVESETQVSVVPHVWLVNVGLE